MGVVFKELPIAGVAVEASLVQGAILALGDAGQALMPGFIQAPLSIGARRRWERHGGDQASQAAATTGGSDEQVVVAEGAQARDVCQVLVRPTADQFFLIKVMGRGRGCGLVAPLA